MASLLHAANLRHGTEGRRAEDFFALKNPTASAGFEPSNLGTKGQHATPRPPKPYFKIHENKHKENQSHFLVGETNWYSFVYILCGSSITRMDCITDLRVLIDTKLHIHQRVDNIFSQTIISPLGLIRTVTFSFSSLHRLLTLYCMRSSRTQVGICLCCVEFYHFGVL
jgi:hypothetical protein